MKRLCVLAVAAALLLSPVAGWADVIKLGLSGPMSGAGASWGLLAEWVAKQAADEINQSGGVKIGDQTYTFEVEALDNKYTASEGAKVGQTLINRDEVRYIVFALGMAPVRALQSLSEKSGAILFTTGAGKSIKGPRFPFTFTQLNTPFERYLPLFGFVTQENKQAKSVVVVDPNDDTGTDAAAVSKRDWARVGIKVLDANFYERGTTEFAPLVTRIVAQDPDIVDFSEMPPSDTGLILAGLQDQGWKGVAVWSAGTSSADLIRSAGSASEGVYMALAGDFSGSNATPVQRRLDAGAMQAMGQHIERHQPLRLGRDHGHPRRHGEGAERRSRQGAPGSARHRVRILLRPSGLRRQGGVPARRSRCCCRSSSRKSRTARRSSAPAIAPAELQARKG